MDTISEQPKSHPASNNSIVILNTSQFFHYQTHQLEIQSPDFRHLAFISKAMKIEHCETDALRLRNQVALVNCLLGNINDGFNFSIPAGLGLADLLASIERGYKQKVS